MKIFLLAASARKDSLNKKFIAVAYQLLEGRGEQLSLRDFKEFAMPVYDGDLEASEGIPGGALALIKALSEADAVILSTPEYNGGTPGPLKNAVDWTSRAKPNPWQGKQVLLLGATPGSLAAVRSLSQTRLLLENLGAFVFPEMLGLPAADKAFAEDGHLMDTKMQDRLGNLLKKFCEYAR